MPQSAAPSLPNGIEIFAAGTRRADDGTLHTITEADLADVVNNYDPALHEAPLTVGHPEGDKPAYGWVAGLSVDGIKLKSDHRAVEPQFAEMVRAERFSKRSAAFYHPQDPANPTPGKWYLRHVAFLGAQPPAIKGLKPIPNFSEAAGAVCFSEALTQEQDDMSKELEQQLAAAKAELEQERSKAAAAEQARKAAEGQVTQFAEQARATQRQGFVAFAESLVNAEGGPRLKPADKDMAVAAMEVLATANPVEFSEGNTVKKVSPLDWFKSVLAGGQPVVQFGEFASRSKDPGADAVAPGSAKGKSDAEIDKAAKAYAAQHKVTYAEAARAVTFTD